LVDIFRHCETDAVLLGSPASDEESSITDPSRHVAEDTIDQAACAENATGGGHLDGERSTLHR
jgi:hypothetical protein